MISSIILATRRSPLALCQARLAQEHVQKCLPQAAVSVREFVTTGDKKAQWSLEKEGGKGLFTKELEDALLSGEVDLAVHSAKDLPTEMPEGLVIAGYLPREAVNDVLVVREDVREPAFIATSSPRRRLQLKRVYPRAVWSEIRGNVETRLKKITSGKAEATVLAAAGLKRLGIHSCDGLVFRPLDIQSVVPAVGQGAIALQCRAADAQRYAALSDEPTARAVTLERRFLAAMGGGCHTSTAGYCAGNTLHVFHENTGYRCFDIPADGVASDLWLAGVVKQVLG